VKITIISSLASLDSTGPEYKKAALSSFFIAYQTLKRQLN